MAASSRSGVSGKIWALAVGVTLVVGVYSAGWFYAASMLKEKTLALLGEQQQRGMTAQCVNAEYRGYPFRIGLFCEKIAVDDSKNGISASFGALRSAAQVYQPSHIVWELDSPAEARTSHGLTASSQWERLQSSLTTTISGIDRSATVIDQLRTNIVSTKTSQAFDILVNQAEIHLRQNGADLDAALTLEDTDISAHGLPQLMPRFTATANVTLANKATLLDGRDASRGVYGLQGEVRKLDLDLGNGQLVSMTGPFSIDEEGRISGKLKLQVEKIGAWRNQLKQAVPGAASSIDTAAKMLSALTGGGDRASLDVTLNRGRVLVGGFIPLGEIPPI
ncbi:DUF2125 domain-containing protein [Rhizobium sp. FY34]|uniref:DUF2125 domain-containing protein n=1 Tax=Rhizobium sp. FY34 TaxID=2562309 RepID=UPI0010BFD2FA|nr:DUF2125 domain-containing protein [Rhizobium sp. FY34]